MNGLSEAAKKDSAVLSLMAHLAFGEKQTGKGFKYLQDALRLEPHSTRIRYDIGRAHLQLGQIKEAENVFLNCLERDP